MAEYTILVVDDEMEIADLVEIYLKNENYQVIKLYESTKVLDTVRQNNISLVILDIMMPEIDGITLCRKIREINNIPILMLSAKSMDMDKVLGLTAGADDYMTKPFNPVELIARVKAQIRRFTKLNPDRDFSENQFSVIEKKGLTIDKRQHQVSLYEEEIALTPIEFDILYLLVANANKVLSSEEIFETVWKEKYYEASNNTVMVHIRHLRDKLRDSSKQPKFIKTVWGVGYKFEE